MRRIRQLDGLRAGAFLVIFLRHAFWIPMLWAGVDCFFVLSGFLITSILIRERQKSAGAFFGRFYGRRFRRIVPPYVLFLLIVALCFHYEWRHLWYWYAFFAANIAESLGRGGNGVLTPLWSLAVEEQFYLCWPLLVYLVPLELLPYALYFLLAAAPVARLLATPVVHSYLPIYFLTPFRMDLLAAGALIAWYTHRDAAWPKKHARKAVAVMIASAAALAVCARWVPHFQRGVNGAAFNTIGYSLLLLFFSGMLIACLALSEKGVTYRFLTARPVTYLGRISYTTYLVHQVALYFFTPLGLWLKAACGLAATIAFAALSWQFMERRLVEHKPERVREGQIPAAARLSTGV